MSLAGLVFVFALASAAAAPLRPNIVWIMADDMGWGEVGLFPAGSEHGRIATPNLDRFGTEGMIFTNAYAGYTVCAPSRTTLFTGRHSGQFVKHDLSGTQIYPSQNVTLVSEILKSAGYQTALVGKSAPLMVPMEQGFDYFIGQINQGACHNMYPHVLDIDDRKVLDLPLNKNNDPSRERCMAHPEMFNYTVDVTQTHGVDWMRAAAAAKDPFFLYLSFTIPHAGGWEKQEEQGAPVPTDGQYADKDWPNVEKDHAAVITYLDNYIGDFMDALKQLGIDNNTLVMFASDNGAHLEGGHDYKFFNSTGGLTGHKRSLYEGGVRSPSLARWPGVVPAGQTSDFQWAFWDVLPTFAELAGAAAPEGLDGISIVPTLLGEQQAPHEYLYFTWDGSGVPPLQSPSGAKPASGYAVRSGQWKGIVPHCSSGDSPSLTDDMMLFDLERDPFEQTDIAQTHPARVVDLLNLVIAQNLTCSCYQC